MPLRILIVDDEELVGRSIARLLKAKGHAVDTTEKAMDAFLQVTGDIDLYDVVITDNTMPDLSGIELLKYLRTANYKGKLIAFSGKLTDESRLQFRLAGADLMFHKPFDLPSLQAAIEQFDKPSPQAG